MPYALVIGRDSPVIRWSGPTIFFHFVLEPVAPPDGEALPSHVDRLGRMAFGTVLLMTPPDCTGLLAEILVPHAGGRDIRPVPDLAALMAVPPAIFPKARLVSFTNPWIVPPHVLAALGYGAYNFHPGPPHLPGLVPAPMAIYEASPLFGATVHHMIEKVDAGPIVAADVCPVPPDAMAFDLEVRAFALLARLFDGLAPHLAGDPAPLPAIPVTWGRRKSTRRMLEDLCTMTPDLAPDEVARRIRAFAGNGFGVDLTMTVHGHRFCLSGDPCPLPDATPRTTVGAA